MGVSLLKSVMVGITMTAASAAIGMPVAQANTVGAIGRYKNCTAYHVYYPHGVGENHAHDHTKGTPVTDFKRNTKLYKLAMRHNSDLDRDKDHIACEKR